MRSSGKKSLLCVVLAAAVFSCGCAATHRVQTSGFLDRSSAAQLPAGTSFTVLYNDSAPNPIFDGEVGRKIEAVLSAKGYRPAAEGQADFFLTYHYDISAHTETQTYPGFRSGPEIVRVVRVRGTSRTYAVLSPGYSHSTYETRTRTVYTARLFVKALAATTVSPPAEQALWIGESMTESSSPDLRESIDPLLAATFRYFAQDTARSREVSLTAEDPLLRQLNALSGGAGSSTPTTAS